MSDLHNSLKDVRAESEQHDDHEGLLAELRDAIDRFFDDIEDESVREALTEQLLILDQRYPGLMPSLRTAIRTMTNAGL